MSSRSKRLAPIPPAADTDTDQQDGPFEHALDMGRLLRTPPATEAADEELSDLGGIDLRLVFVPDTAEDDAALDEPLHEGVPFGPLLDPEIDTDDTLPEPSAAQRAQELALDMLGNALDELPTLDAEEDERHFEPIVLPKNDFLQIEFDDEQPEHSSERAPSGQLQVLGSESRFRASYRLQQNITRAALCKDGLLIAGTDLSWVQADGQVQQLTALPAAVQQLLSHETEGWAVLSTTDGRLYRVSEGAWQPQALAMPRGVALGAEVQLFTLEEQPKLMAASLLWDLVGRATQIVPDPSVQRVLRVSEPSAEYAVCRTASGFNLVHLLHNSSHMSSFDWNNPRTLLSSAGGRLAVLTARGDLCLMDRPNEVRKRVLLNDPVLALTMGVVGGEALVWLLRQTQDELEVLELEFSTGVATRIFRQPRRAQEDAAQLLWSVSERVLYVITHDELVALKRLEA